MVGLPAIVGYLMRVAPVWPKLKAAAHTLPYDAAVLGDFSLPRERAAAVAVPTLLIGGEKSSVELRAAARATAEAVPGAQLRMLQGQTHNPSAKVVAPVLAEFFSGLGSMHEWAERPGGRALISAHTPKFAVELIVARLAAIFFLRG